MNLTEIQAGALNLPEEQRAALASELFDLLPAVIADFDDGSFVDFEC